MANIVDYILNLEALQRTAMVLVFLVLAYIIHQKTTIRYPSNLPRVRDYGRTSFSFKTRLAYFTDCETLYREAYETYSKHGKTCLVPGIGRDEIILPGKDLRWMVAQPDNILSLPDAFAAIDQAHYTLGSEQYVLDGWQATLVRTNIPAVLEKLGAAINNELPFAFNGTFGADEIGWKELNVWTTVKRIVAQASSRFTVGLPLCRNEEYLTASSNFPDHFVFSVGITSLTPRILRPLIGTLAYIPQHLNLRTMKTHFAPLLAERIALCKNTEKTSPSEPQDHLQMMVRYALTERPEDLSSPTVMTTRLALSNLGSFHQTSMALTNIIFNILASDAEYNTILVLREEINSVIGEKGEWTKANVAKMVKCDSVCKETMRIHPFGHRSPFRKVMVDGLKTEDGITLPKGAMLSLLLTPQVDEDIFPDPMKFKPFRFVELRENGDTTAGFVSVGEKYLVFGYGKHACPGRFLLDFELKMILAYMLTNYDIELAPEHNGVRPESKWVAEATVAPSEGRIRVKKIRSA